MKELVISITPFILTQNLFIFENGKLINAESFQLKDIAKVVFSKDNVEKVVLCGNRNYVEKFKNKSITFRMSSFSHSMSFTVSLTYLGVTKCTMTAHVRAEMNTCKIIVFAFNIFINFII